MAAHLEGLIPAAYTPMHPDGTLNLDRVGAMADLLWRNKAIGAFIAGTTGEGVSLTTAERLELTRVWVSDAPAGFKVFVHIGHNSLVECKALAAHAQKSGVYAVAMNSPSFFKPAGTSQLVTFCREVAAAAPDLPFYIYHIPSMTGVSFPMVDFFQEAKKVIPNLAGVKYSHDNLMDLQQCLALDNGRFDVLFGIDQALLCYLVLGGRGAVGSTYNFAAPLFYQIIAAFDRGDLPEARRLQLQSVGLVEHLLSYGVPFISASKAIMGFFGVECGPTRLPLPTIRPEQVNNLRNGLENIGFFEYACR